MKWQRNYQITITNPDGDKFIIKPPFTAKITTKSSISEAPNQATATIYNLGRNTRNALHKDKFAYYDRWPISVEAGYGDKNLYLIFKGNIREAYSERKETDWITTLDFFDGEYAMQNGQLCESLSKKGDLDGIIADAAKGLGLDIGYVLARIPKSRRGTAVKGSLQDLLNMTIPRGWFIDKEELHILGKTGVIPDAIFKLSQNQLLSTPRKRDRCINVQTLFYPQLTIGRYCELECSVLQYNGKYQVAEVNHEFEWSGADGGVATTQVLLFDQRYAEEAVLFGSLQ